MTADAHDPLSLAFIAALERVAGRAWRFRYQLQGVLQTRFGIPSAVPHTGAAGAPLIPTLRYRDVPTAISWLCRAFGMKLHRVVTDSGGAPRYAELTVGSGMLMVAPIEDTVFGRLLVQPDEIGGVETQVCYLRVADARAHHARAKAAGAVIIIDPEHESNNGRGYSCRDPEGHVWNFGTYDPWEKRPAPARVVRNWGGVRRAQQGLAALVLLTLAGGLLFEIAPQPSARASTAATGPPPPAPGSSDAQTPDARMPGAVAAFANDTAGPEAPGAERDDAHDDAALAAAERTAAEARDQLAEARAALDRARREAAAARGQLDEVQRARQTAERAAADARERLAAAQKTAERAREDAAEERARRMAADGAAARARTRASVGLQRSRARSIRSWCYNSIVPNPASRGRLSGFCKT